MNVYICESEAKRERERERERERARLRTREGAPASLPTHAHTNLCNFILSCRRAYMCTYAHMHKIHT